MVGLASGAQTVNVNIVIDRRNTQTYSFTNTTMTLPKHQTISRDQPRQSNVRRRNLCRSLLAKYQNDWFPSRQRERCVTAWLGHAYARQVFDLPVMLSLNPAV